MENLLHHYTGHKIHGNHYCQKCGTQVPEGFLHRHLSLNEVIRIVDVLLDGKPDPYVESLRETADRARGSADHRALVIGDLTRKLENANRENERLRGELERALFRLILHEQSSV
jgi:hypothetical protein